MNDATKGISIMNRCHVVLVLAILTAASAGVLTAQAVDISGTWTGTTVVPNAQDKDVITLMLKKDGDTYLGVMNDTLGMVNQAVLKDVKYENGTLTFNFAADAGEQQVRVDASLTLTGDKLVGNWTSAGGDSGTFELERQK